MTLKILGLAGLFVLSVVGVALMATGFMYAGWNWGLVPATHGCFKEIGLGTAFWMSLLLSMVGSAFKSSVSSNSRSQ